MTIREIEKTIIKIVINKYPLTLILKLKKLNKIRIKLLKIVSKKKLNRNKMKRKYKNNMKHKKMYTNKLRIIKKANNNYLNYIKANFRI